MNPKDLGAYPHLDDDGNFASYQEGGRWINWWARKKPNLLTLFKEFLTNRDESGIPRSKEELDAVLPVFTPYFVGSPGSQGDARLGRIKTAHSSFPGDDQDHQEPDRHRSPVRATWIGHATVLAEVGATVLLTDPMFSDRASMFSFAGPKRYRGVHGCCWFI